jgi:hypothetical protein
MFLYHCQLSWPDFLGESSVKATLHIFCFIVLLNLYNMFFNITLALDIEIFVKSKLTCTVENAGALALISALSFDLNKNKRFAAPKLKKWSSFKHQVYLDMTTYV